MKANKLTLSERGKVANAARNKALSVGQRRELARKAALARWKKARDKRASL